MRCARLKTKMLARKNSVLKKAGRYFLSARRMSTPQAARRLPLAVVEDIDEGGSAAASRIGKTPKRRVLTQKAAVTKTGDLPPRNPIPRQHRGQD